jgi:hypothetical protein
MEQGYWFSIDLPDLKKENGRLKDATPYLIDDNNHLYRADF